MSDPTGSPAVEPGPEPEPRARAGRWCWRYAGPTTRWGLHEGARVALVPGELRRGGLATVETGDGKRWRVPASQLVRVEP